jgi:hypothetical protein
MPAVAERDQPVGRRDGIEDERSCRVGRVARSTGASLA